MNHQTFAPPDILRPFVKYFWALEVRRVDHSPKTFSAIVDGCPGVIMVQSEEATFCDVHQKKLPNAFLYGQTIRPVQLSSTGKFDAIGICFQPHALQSVFGIDANELTGSCVDLNLVNKHKHNKLPELLFNAGSLDDTIKRLSCYLFDLVKSNNKKVDEITQYALMQIVQTSGNIPLKELQQKLQLSERSLERRFKQTIGVSPKLYTRICQFQKSLDQLRKSKYDKLSDIAYENDYSDQSHFIRVFKEFTGLSPFEFKKQSKEVVENLTQIAG